MACRHMVIVSSDLKPFLFLPPSFNLQLFHVWRSSVRKMTAVAAVASPIFFSLLVPSSFVSFSISKRVNFMCVCVCVCAMPVCTTLNGRESMMNGQLESGWNIEWLTTRRPIDVAWIGLQGRGPSSNWLFSGLGSVLIIPSPSPPPPTHHLLPGPGGRYHRRGHNLNTARPAASNPSIDNRPRINNKFPINSNSSIHFSFLFFF